MSATPSYLTEAQLREDTEFPQVLAKSATHLSRYIFRAHALAESHGPFVSTDMLDDVTVVAEVDGTGYTERGLFLQDMRVALGMITERLIFAASSAPAAAAGLTSERIGKYEYSRSSGASRTGDPIKSQLLTEEILAIFDRWKLSNADEDILIERTDVFVQTAYADELDHSRKVVVDEDFDRLAPSVRTNSYGERYGAPFG